ncbi:hypothetical protein ACWDKQ_32180 [Saccharopolyspora sp. NPDC000995]
MTVGEVTRFVVGACVGRPRGSAKLMVTALRSLLRFLHVEGVTAGLLVSAVPSVASWRLASLPRGLEPGQVRGLLDSCVFGSQRLTAHQHLVAHRKVGENQITMPRPPASAGDGVLDLVDDGDVGDQLVARAVR